MKNAAELWHNVLSVIEEEQRTPKASYDMWLKSTEGVTLNGTTLIVSAPAAFTVTWLERQYLSLLEDTVEEVTGSRLDIQFIEEGQAKHMLDRQNEEVMEVAPEDQIQRHANRRMNSS